MSEKYYNNDKGELCEHGVDDVEPDSALEDDGMDEDLPEKMQAESEKLLGKGESKPNPKKGKSRGKKQNR